MKVGVKTQTNSRLGVAQDRTNGQQFVLRRKCACEGSSTSHGECKQCRKKQLKSKLPFGQAKLAINDPGDTFEQEADRIAEQVTRMTNPPRDKHPMVAHKSSGFASRRRVGDGDESLRKRESHGQGMTVDEQSLSIASVVQHVLNSSGQPLDAGTRTFMEPRFGHDFSQVRVQTDSAAAQTAAAMGALAFTVGDEVFLGRQQYAPQTNTGRRLIAHELAHVVQQEKSAIGSRYGSSIVSLSSPPGMVQCKYPEQPASPTYSLLEPKRLNPDGIFSSKLLDLISTSYTEAAIYSEPETAHLILEILESSDDFVFIAKKLDEFYAAHPDRTLLVRWSFTGTQYVPSGEPYQFQYGDPIHSAAPYDIIAIDPKSSYKFNVTYGENPGAIQAMVFAKSIMHEASHAYRNISGKTWAGLQGSIMEEKSTRELERRMLQQSAAATTLPAVKAEAEAYIAGIEASGLTLPDVARSVVSGDKISYLEKYYLNTSLKSLQIRYEELTSGTRSDSVAGLEGLKHPSTASFETIGAYYEAIRLILKANVQTRAIESDVSETTDRPLAVSEPAATRIEELISSSLTLVQVDKAATKAEDLSAQEQLIYFYVLLVKIQEIKLKIQKERQDSTFEPRSAEYIKFCDRLAADFLGRPNAYGGL